MGEKVESIEGKNEGIKELSNRRILFLMALVILVGSILGFIFVSNQFGFGALLGGILAFANYYWLKVSLKSVFAKAVSGERTRFLAGKYILRYLIFGLVLMFIYLSAAVDVIAVILGLASFALAVVVEGIINIFTSFNK
jgi:hypothetical protein